MKKKKDSTEKVIDAIASLRDHGDSCGCSICVKDAQTVADNPTTAKMASKLTP